MDSTDVSATSHRQSNAGSTTRAHMVCSTPPNANPYDSDTVCQPRLHKTEPRQVCMATAQRSAAAGLLTSTAAGTRSTALALHVPHRLPNQRGIATPA